jgi:membrane protease YdiL (CAAX protease family)
MRGNESTVARAAGQLSSRPLGAKSKSDTFMAMTSSFSKLSRSRNLSVALAVVGLVIGGEYFFRHYVLFWLPIFGTLLVNDMLSLFLVYLLLPVGLGPFMHVNWQQELAGVVQSLREGLTSWNFTFWVLALVLGVWALSVVDRHLWGSIQLPMIVSSYRNSTICLPKLGPVLKVVSLILVNGLFVPIVEEFLWRGLVQVRLSRILPIPLAIGLTAVLFSLKHVLVDASLGRFLALIAFGAICGVVAEHNSWRRSAALHMVANTVATVIGLVFGLT